MMHRQHVHHLIALTSLLACLAGCSERLNGRYDEASGVGSLDFQRDGRVYITMQNATVVGAYDVDGDHIIVSGPRGMQIYTRRGEALHGDFGMTYVRQ